MKIKFKKKMMNKRKINLKYLNSKTQKTKINLKTIKVMQKHL